MSLRSKIIIAFTLCFILTFAPLLYIMQNEVKIINMDKAEHHALQFMDSKSNELGSWLDERMGQMEVIQELPFVKEMDIPKIKDFATSMNIKINNYSDNYTEGITIGDINGQGWITNSFSVDLSERDYIKQILDPDFTEDYIISEPLISKSKDEDQIFLITLPIYDYEDNKVGFINGSVTLGIMSDIINDIDIYDGFPWLMNTNKDIYSTDKENLNNNYIDDDGLDKIINSFKENESGTLKLKNINGEDITVFYSAIPFADDWIVSTMIREESINSEANLVINIILKLFILFMLVSLVLSFLISASIVKPIQILKENMSDVSNGNLDSYYIINNNDEISVLGQHFNNMLDNIKKLIDQVYIIENQKRKAELKSLQSQINPHFLYNTLDTLHWKALEYDDEEFAQTIQSLSGLFRISLSSGKEFITVSDEIQHVEYYLKIQNVRYDNNINYNITVEKGIKQFLIPKLIIQPLVENSIYHGLKNNIGLGNIDILVNSKDGFLFIKVEDDGIGIKPDKLQILRNNLSMSVESENYGLYNVNERLKLIFGPKYDIEIQSIYSEGTKVILKIPIQSEGFECIES